VDQRIAPSAQMASASASETETETDASQEAEVEVEDEDELSAPPSDDEEADEDFAPARRKPAANISQRKKPIIRSDDEDSSDAFGSGPKRKHARRM
jgi:hypothetical protein